jgi:unspecific monooxygenase
MQLISQNPTNSDFIQNPYKFYKNFISDDCLYFWQEYNMPAVFDYAGQEILFKDKRFGREKLEDHSNVQERHLNMFNHVETNSMLELEPPKHTRLRGLVLRAFTTRKINTLQTEIALLSHELLDDLKVENVDILKEFATLLPVIVIARLLGVPESMAKDLLGWSNDMVMMYQARRTKELEIKANSSTKEFVSFMEKYIEEKRFDPKDDLISHLISAEEEGDKLSKDELISTCILLLNAGHEATVHTLGNGIKTIIEYGKEKKYLLPEFISATVEEILRYDPPLHIFTRYAYEDVHFRNHKFKRGDQVALVIGAAGRDEKIWNSAHSFNPFRSTKKNLSFGSGIHFCVGAPLARLELVTALPIIFDKFPNIKLLDEPLYSNLYHFHGLRELNVSLNN